MVSRITAYVDLIAWHELIDVDRVVRLQRDVVELVLGDFEVGVGVDLVALDDILAIDVFASFGVDPLILDPVSSLAVDLVERDLFGVRGRRKQCDRTSHQGEA
jgi:hypothetical protein